MIIALEQSHAVDLWGHHLPFYQLYHKFLISVYVPLPGGMKVFSRDGVFSQMNVMFRLSSMTSSNVREYQNPPSLDKHDL